MGALAARLLVVERSVLARALRPATRRCLMRARRRRRPAGSPPARRRPPPRRVPRRPAARAPRRDRSPARGGWRGVSSLPYVDDAGHLRDELRRIDALVRAQTVRWQATLASDKPPELWGMVTVTTAEVDRYLRSPFRAPFDSDTDLAHAVREHVGTAVALRAAIDARLEATPGPLAPRLDRLRRDLALSDAERDVLLVCLLGQI